MEDRKIKKLFSNPWNSAGLVALLTLLVFLPVIRGEFLSWDDNGLFVKNPWFRGLGADQWRWMCTTVLYGHWQPLSWLSYALDYTLWGMNPHRWHVTNLLLHIVNSVLVYRLCLAFIRPAAISDKNLRTGASAAAALAALFWAVHPLRVEVVAWLSTRGYLLCTAFCLLTLLFYLRATDQKRYPFAALLCFTLASLTKGIGMMLPPVLLLIDWQRAGRMAHGEGGPPDNQQRTTDNWKLLVEKFPFFALSLLTGITAFLAKKTAGGMASVEHYGLPERIGQVLYGFWFYLFKTVFPLNLSPLYYKTPEVGAIALVFVLTAAASVFLFLFRRQMRPLIIALGSFLFLILPMLGLTQSGLQLFADRFTYLSLIPFSVLLGAGLARMKKFCRMVCAALAVLLVLFGFYTFIWSVSWQDSLTLWARAVSVDNENPQAQNSAGMAFKQIRQYETALEHFNRAIRLNPGYVKAWHNRSVVLALTEQYDAAFSGWETAFSIPLISAQERMRMHWARGWVFEQTGNFSAAESDYTCVIEDKNIPLVDRAAILQLRAEMYARTGEAEKARIDLHRILDWPDPFGTLHPAANRMIEEISESGE